MTRGFNAGIAFVQAVSILLAVLGVSFALLAEEVETTEKESASSSAIPPKGTVIGGPLKLDIPTVQDGRMIALAEALKLADSRNLSLAAVRADLEKARAEFGLVWSTLLPIAAGTMTYTHADHEDIATMGGFEVVTRRRDNLQGRLQASMPIIDAKSWINVEAGKLAVIIAELTIENARQELLLAVSQAFYQALMSRALIDVQENLILSAHRHQEIARTRHISGVGSRLDVIRARSELARIRQELLAAHRVLDNARDALGILIGLEGLPMPVEGPDFQVPTDTEKVLIKKAMTAREDVKMSRKRVKFQERKLDASWVQFLPTLNASWQLTHMFTQPSAFGSQDRSRWNALVTLTVPLYNQSRYADLDIKRAALRKAMIEKLEVEQNAGLEVRTARRDYDTALKQLDIVSEQATLSREAVTLSQTAYETGTGSSLEVTDASRQSRQDEVTLALKRLEVQLALIKLLRATGEKMDRVKASPDK